MRTSLNRRDFLRLAGLLPLSLAAPRWPRKLSGAAGQQNVLIVVFDALSARHLSLHGYGRETMPNLTALAERAIVYHNHYASSNFTSPGTASLLTGTLPWTHRALRGGGRVAAQVADHNLFELFGDYYRLTYTHNSWAEILLRQFSGSLDEFVPRRRLYLGGQDFSPLDLFVRDDDIAMAAWTRYISRQDGYGYSLFSSRLHESEYEKRVQSYVSEYPLGLPTGIGRREPFLLEDAVAWFGRRLPAVPQPFLGYLHFLPPHAPYDTRTEFHDRFRHDGLRIVQKPTDLFAGILEPGDPPGTRDEYDEFLLYADKEFGAFYSALEDSGLLENTWLIFTSDHGEMFERGIVGHMNPTLYEPVLRVPLLIFEPGGKQRLDIRDRTTAVDLVPTLAHVTGHDIPSWLEGSILPPFAPARTERSVYASYARNNNPSDALTVASTVLFKESYKLHYYFGYSILKGSPFVRLFNVRQDPEEMEDLSSSEKGTTAALLDELKAKIAEVNRPYA